VPVARDQAISIEARRHQTHSLLAWQQMYLLSVSCELGVGCEVRRDSSFTYPKFTRSKPNFLNIRRKEQPLGCWKSYSHVTSNNQLRTESVRALFIFLTFSSTFSKQEPLFTDSCPSLVAPFRETITLCACSANRCALASSIRMPFVRIYMAFQFLPNSQYTQDTVAALRVRRSKHDCHKWVNIDVSNDYF